MGYELFFLWVCDLGQGITFFWLSVFSSLKWGWTYSIGIIVVRATCKNCSKYTVHTQWCYVPPLLGRQRADTIVMLFICPHQY